MADEKKPGKDINDLKARLGLKEQRPQTPAPQAAPAPGPTASDVRRDPFASQAPRPVVIEQAPMFTDAGPQMHIPDAPKQTTAAIIKLVAMIALPSLLCFGFGLVYRARLLYNRGVEDAQTIKDEVQSISKRTESIYNAVKKSLETAKFDPDQQLTSDLKALEPLTAPKTDKIFRINYTQLENVTIERLFNYYYDTIALYATVSRFHSQAERVMPDLKKALEKGKSMQTKYGIVLDPSGPFPVGKLVIWGDPICKDKQPDCAPEAWEGLKVKASTGSSWSNKMLVGEDAQRVIPLRPEDPLAQQALLGSAETTSLLFYRAQLTDIHSLIKKVREGEKDLLKELTDTAAKPKVFTF